MPVRPLACSLAVGNALVAARAAADEQPPTQPDSTKGTKRCGTTARFGHEFRVHITKGRAPITCRRARRVVRAGLDVPTRWDYLDWTKRGNGPWTDVVARADRRVVSGAILQGY